MLAALVLAVWVLLTGGLHLDGLADTADAWIGGQGDRDRTLAIMKDPRSGPAAIVAIVLVLLAKFAALQALLAEGEALYPLLLAPVLGRTVIVLLLLVTPYVRPAGLGAPYAESLPRLSGGAVVVLVAVGVVLLLGGPGGAVLAALGVEFLGFRYGLLIRLGGATGDMLGAACELTEVGVLLGMVLLGAVA